MNAEIINLLMKPKRDVYREYRERVEDLYGQGGLDRLDAELGHIHAEPVTETDVYADIEWLPGSIPFESPNGTEPPLCR